MEPTQPPLQIPLANSIEIPFRTSEILPAPQESKSEESKNVKPQAKSGPIPESQPQVPPMNTASLPQPLTNSSYLSTSKSNTLGIPLYAMFSFNGSEKEDLPSNFRDRCYFS